MDYATLLRGQLRQLAQEWASTHKPSYLSLGTIPTVLFEPHGAKCHGNFEPHSWLAICARPEWSHRLGKPHSRQRALPLEKRATAKELDSSNSSDALLMNCFCYPGAADALLAGLRLPAQPGLPQFGFKAKLTLTDGTTDRTEIDMCLGGLLFEAKLTERDFTSRPYAHVLRYRDLTTHFVVEELPAHDGRIKGYQVVRNVLAAAQLQGTSVVLLDERRPDLLDEWKSVRAAIRDAALRERCVTRYWQQVAAPSPAPLRAFLRQKYGL